jgi:hypothetical protein
LQPHPRVQPAIEHICYQVYDDEDKGGEQHRTHHQREVEFIERINGYFADTLPAKNVFYKKGTCQQLCQPARNGCDNRIQRNPFA